MATSSCAIAELPGGARRRILYGIRFLLSSADCVSSKRLDRAFARSTSLPHSVNCITSKVLKLRPQAKVFLARFAQFCR